MKSASVVVVLGLVAIAAVGCNKPGGPPAAKPAADAGAVAAAEEDGRTADYAACTEAAHEVTSRELDCLDAEFERQDKAMNETYAALMACTSSEHLGQLGSGFKGELASSGVDI